MKLKLLTIIVLGCSLVGCSSGKLKQQGYMEGDYTYIAPDYPGILVKLNVFRGTFIKAGTPLFVLEQEPENAQLKQAESKLAEAQAQKAQYLANLSLAQITLKRQSGLYNYSATAKENLDTARSNYDQAKAQVSNYDASIAENEAAVEQASWQKGTKAVNSVSDALVFDTFFRPGEYIPAGQPVLALLKAEDIYAVFYIPEQNLSRLSLGQKVKITCDSCKEPVAATIRYISPQAEYTPPVIFSNDTRYKLTYRVEAFPALQDAYKLHPGQPVVVIDG